MRKTISHQILIFALIVLGTIILIYCLANRFQRVISEPILKLAAFTDEISQTADFSLQIPKQSEDETGKLYDNFNNMIRQIKAKQEERNKANKALFDSEEKYRNLIKYTPLPLCIVENDGKIVFINDRFKKVFGYKLEDIPTLDEWWEKAYPDEKYRSWVLDTWNKAVDKARIEKTDIESVEYQVTCKNNQRFG